MNEFIKFYADAPDGTKNKILCYKVKDFDNSLDLLSRFLTKGWIIRTAYHHFENGKQVQIKKALIDRYLTQTNTN